MREKARQIWNSLGYVAKKNHLETFANQFSGAYKSYYKTANVESMGNDSLFMIYFEKQVAEVCDFELRKEEIVKSGYLPIDNLTCEPPELEAARIKEISGRLK